MFDFITSDQHFGHKRIIELCDRPFRDLDEMQETLIRRYNDRVQPGQICVWAGDSFFSRVDAMAYIMSRLNGRKVLVRGNHDKRTRTAYRRAGFEEVFPEIECVLAKTPCKIRHIPPVYPKGDVIIHGHTHSTKRLSAVGVHVGVDAWGYAPASRQEIEELIKKKS